MDNNASSPNRLKPFHYFPQKFYRHNQASFLSSHFPQQPKSTNSMFQSRVNNNSPNLNLNHLDDTINNDEDTDINNDPLASTVVDKEPLFEKPLTPSDVGKLNRLVIPKQYAEKYFPLAGGDSEEKGLLLSFEDELGKFWRFRYSYWNSSQSYVLTKGWSRYVKEKRLDAGDVVLFLRHCSDYDRFFIGWRRRASAQDSGVVFGSSMAQVSHGGENCDGGGGGSRDGWTEILYSAHEAYPTHHHHHHQNHALPYQPDYLLAGSSMGETQVSSVGNSRILRLFGVNMECQAQVDDEEESSGAYAQDGSSLSSQGSDHLQLYPTPAYYSNHMDYNFSRDIKPMRNQRG